MKKRRAIFLVLLAASVFTAFAQSGTSIEAEIQSTERVAARQGISAVERHDALVRLARLRRLSGDIEGAARNWLEAAAAIPGQVDDDALLACAYCLAAMGEWDRARTAIEPLLSKSSRARFLDLSMTAINTGNTSALAALASNSEYSQIKSEIYFMLWKTSSGESAENWRRRLVSEFSQTPEGRLASEGTSAVVMRQSPFWLLIGGDGSQASFGRTVQTAPQSAPPPQIAPPPQTPAQPQVALQTGIFDRRANADAQMANLRQAGFSPSIEQRIVNNNEMWAVTVPAGSDQARSIRELKDAGFDSFPIRQ